MTTVTIFLPWGQGHQGSLEGQQTQGDPEIKAEGGKTFPPGKLTTQQQQQKIGMVWSYLVLAKKKLTASLLSVVLSKGTHSEYPR